MKISNKVESAKKKFFDDLPPDAFALINKDDKNGTVMVQNTRANILPLEVRSQQTGSEAFDDAYNGV